MSLVMLMVTIHTLLPRTMRIENEGRTAQTCAPNCSESRALLHF